MDKEFELVVEHVPSPDAEERLRRVFDILLTPMPSSEEEPHPVQPDQPHLGTHHPCDVAGNPQPLVSTTVKQELT